MPESEPSPSPLGALHIREIALLTVAVGLVSLVSFGLGYVTGRDRAGLVHGIEQARGIDAELADPELVELLAQIEVANAADKGLSELRYPHELRGQPQERAPSGGYAIDLGPVPASRLDDLQTVLRGRNLHTQVVSDLDETRILVGAYADRQKAAAWLAGLQDVVVDFELSPPKVVATATR